MSIMYSLFVLVLRHQLEDKRATLQHYAQQYAKVKRDNKALKEKLLTASRNAAVSSGVNATSSQQPLMLEVWDCLRRLTSLVEMRSLQDIEIQRQKFAQLVLDTASQCFAHVNQWQQQQEKQQEAAPETAELIQGLLIRNGQLALSIQAANRKVVSRSIAFCVCYAL